MSELLSNEAISARLQGLSGWSIDGEGCLTKVFEFPAYKDGLAFAAAVGFLADRLDHHPDLLIGYRKVRLTVSTHSAGGITELDFELARRVEALF
jgi:4a-hydroxytetrahydrobiopterin dehydratase